MARLLHQTPSRAEDQHSRERLPLAAESRFVVISPPKKMKSLTAAPDCIFDG
jgi:hypothetical protein